MIKRIVLFVFLFVLVSNLSFATKMSREEVTCPLCGTQFTARVVMSTNNFGGMDHDLCPHAVGYTPIADYVWGCPNCNLCGYPSVFKKEYSNEEKTKIQNWLKENYPPKTEKPKQDDEEEVAYRQNQYGYTNLPSYKRYEIAAELAKLTNKSNYEIGKMFLSATWCVRANMVINKDGKALNENTFSRFMENRNKIINEEGENIARNLDPIEARTFTMADFYIRIADSLEKKEIKEEEKLDCYTNLAVQLRCSGENTKAEVYIKKAEKCKDAEKLSDLFEGLRNSIKQERSYQAKVIEFLSASLNDNLEEMQILEVNLLLGEMNRRIEKYDEAQKYYSKLLENPESLPEQIMRTVKFANSVMDGKDSSQLIDFDKIEEKKVNTYLTQLPYTITNREISRYLSLSTKRDIIYPKLVEIINSALKNPINYSMLITEQGGHKYLLDPNSRSLLLLNDDSPLPNYAVTNALMAMSDETEEAAKFQYDLLDKGLDERVIIDNLSNIAQFLPSEKFIQRFNNATSTEAIVKYLGILKVIGDKPSFEAIITKAEKMLDDEGLKNLIYKDYRDKNRDACYALAESLAFFRGKRTIDFLVNLCDRIKIVHDQIKEKDPEKHCSELYELYERAGTSLEIMFFRHFGFSVAYNRKHDPKELKELVRGFKLIEEPLISFKEWYAKYGNEDYKKIIYEGFKKYGYDILPVSDPKKLYVLVEGLDDTFSAASIQSYKELVRRTGIRKRPSAGLKTGLWGRDARQELISFYNKWLEENISKLVYDENKHKFIIKQ